MPTGEIDAEVTSFVLTHVDSVSHLEGLLLMWQGGSSWSIRDLAARLYVPEPKARLIIDDLRRRGFVIAEGHEHYRFDPQWDSEGHVMAKLADAHRRQLVQITTLIHSKGSPSVREFARAFQLKKE